MGERGAVGGVLGGVVVSAAVDGVESGCVAAVDVGLDVAELAFCVAESLLHAFHQTLHPQPTDRGDTRCSDNAEARVEAG